MRELDSTSVESSELVEHTFKFWFRDNEHIRSPFPSYIQPELKVKSTDRFYAWAVGLDPKAKDELNDEAVGEKFEEIIFEVATGLIKTEDERITILYPFLPRLGDALSDDDKKASTVIDRKIYKEGDTSLLKVVCKEVDSEKKWETEFQLPL